MIAKFLNGIFTRQHSFLVGSFTSLPHPYQRPLHGTRHEDRYYESNNAYYEVQTSVFRQSQQVLFDEPRIIDDKDIQHSLVVPTSKLVALAYPHHERTRFGCTAMRVFGTGDVSVNSFERHKMLKSKYELVQDFVREHWHDAQASLEQFVKLQIPSGSDSSEMDLYNTRFKVTLHAQAPRPIDKELIVGFCGILETWESYIKDVNDQNYRCGSSFEGTVVKRAFTGVETPYRLEFHLLRYLE